MRGFLSCVKFAAMTRREQVMGSQSHSKDLMTNQVRMHIRSIYHPWAPACSRGKQAIVTPRRALLLVAERARWREPNQRSIVSPDRTCWVFETKMRRSSKPRGYAVTKLPGRLFADV